MNKIITFSLVTLILSTFSSFVLAAETQSVGIEPFTEIPSTFPPDFKGNDLKALIKFLKTNSEKLGLIKDEFTSSSEFLPKVKKVVQELNEKGAYIFVLDKNALKSTYNSEKKRYDITLDFHHFGYGDNQDLTGFRLVEDTTVQSKYNASNAYGKSIAVDKTSYDTYAIGSNRLKFTGDFHIAYGVMPDEARLLKNDMTLVFVCKIQAPPLMDDVDGYRPKIDFPYDITYNNHILNVTFLNKSSATLIQVSTGKVLGLIDLP